MGLLLEAAGNDAKNILREENIHTEAFDAVKDIGDRDGDTKAIVDKEIAKVEEKYNKLKAANSLTAENELYFKMLSLLLNDYAKAADKMGVYGIQKAFEANIKKFKENVNTVKAHFKNMFDFCEDVFGEGSRELLILVTELAADPFTAKYIANFGCEEYHKHDKALMFYERKNEILEEINKLGL